MTGLTQIKSSLRILYYPLAFVVIMIFFTWLKPLNESIVLLELKLLDYRYQLRQNLKIDPRVTMVDIDTESLKKEGRWSWPYEKHAQLVNILRYLEIQSLGFDIFLVEPSRNVIEFDRLINSGKKVFTYSELWEMKSNSDEIMTDALTKSGRVFLPQIFASSDETEETGHEYYDFFKENKQKSFQFQKKFSLPVTSAMKSFLKANESSPLLYYFAQAVKGTAFAQILPDVDGTVRHYPLFYQYEGRAYLALGFMMALDDMGIPISAVKVVSPERIEISRGKQIIHVPINSKGLLLINWMGKYMETYPHIPYIAVIRLVRHIQLRELKKIILRDQNLLWDEAVLKQHPKIRELINELGEIDTCLLQLQAASIAQAFLNDNPRMEFDQFVLAAEVPQENQEAVKSIFLNVKYHNLIYLHRDWIISDFIPSCQIEDTVFFRQCYHDFTNRQIGQEDFPLFFYDPVRLIGMGTIDERYFKDKVVFYGLTATGTHDYNPTPYEPRYAMVGVHANIFDNLIHQNFLRESRMWQNILYWLILTIVMSWGLSRLKTLLMGLTAISIFAMNLLINYWVFSQLNIWYQLLTPSVLIIGHFVIISIYRYRREEKEKRKIKDAFSHYVAPSVVEIILKKQGMLKLGGEKRWCTVFFSDIQGFTSISERSDPVELVESLNSYLNRVTQIILRHGGMLDKYEGDAVMAVFGAPLELPGHAAKACQCALDVQKSLKQNLAYPTRIGINTGEMIAGNMGSTTRFNYTVIGDAVNLGSRLEGANKEFGSTIMISEFSAREVQDYFLLRELDIIRVKGKSKPVKVFELIESLPDASDELVKWCRDYHQALEWYKKRDWGSASKSFQSLGRIYPLDQVTTLYCRRCELHLNNPPAPDWDGVFEMVSK